MQSNPDAQFNRWYDQDPVLSQAMEQLRRAPNKYQAQVALNIIKIIIEHQIEGHVDLSDDALSEEQMTLKQLRGWVDLKKGLSAGDDAGDDEVALQQQSRRRWYDVHETLSSAIQLLADCPEDLQQKIIPSIAVMIETTLKRTE